MKKFLSFLGIFIISFVVLSCGANATDGVTTEDTTNEATTSETVSNEVTTTEDVMTSEDVTTEPIALTSLQIIGTVEAYYFIDDEVQLGVLFNPINASDKSVTWSTSDDAVVTVDQNGLVSCVGLGSAEVTVTANSDSEVSASVTFVVEEDILFGLTKGMLDAIPAETNMARWDIAWGDHPGEFVGDLFDLTNSASEEDVIWRQVNPKASESVLADAGYGAILNVLESEDDDLPGLAIYNKLNLDENATSLEVIARGTPNGANGGDPSLSGRGMFRVSFLVPTETGYELNVLSQITNNYPQDESGWISYEEPPVVDQKDAFLFDVSAFAGMDDIIVVIEGNDRLDTVGEGDTNLADRVNILAVRVIVPDYVFGDLEKPALDALASETNLARWDFAWGGQGATTTLIDFANTALDTDMIWRQMSYVENSVVADAGYGAILNAFETEDGEDAAVAMYNKLDVPENAEKLVVVARGQEVADTLSGAGQFRVVVYYLENDVYVSETLMVELTEAQVNEGITQDEFGYVTWDNPPTVDANDLFTFDLSGLANTTGAVVVIEANDRMDTTGSDSSNLADRVLVLAIRVIEA